MTTGIRKIQIFESMIYHTIERGLKGGREMCAASLRIDKVEAGTYK